jgi:hypothetical protein
MPSHFDPDYLVLEHTRDLVNEVRDLRLEILALRMEIEAMREGRPSPEAEARKGPPSRLTELLRQELNSGRLED